jgi:hypothetical protein
LTIPRVSAFAVIVALRSSIAAQDAAPTILRTSASAGIVVPRFPLPLRLAAHRPRLRKLKLPSLAFGSARKEL